MELAVDLQLQSLCVVYRRERDGIPDIAIAVGWFCEIGRKVGSIPSHRRAGGAFGHITIFHAEMRRSDRCERDCVNCSSDHEICPLQDERAPSSESVIFPCK